MIAKSDKNFFGFSEIFITFFPEIFATPYFSGLLTLCNKTFSPLEILVQLIKVLEKMSSWDFFDHLLEKASVVGTPGSGFGLAGEGYFRLSAFNSRLNVINAMERIINI